MNKVSIRAITAAALVVAIAVYWLGLRDRKEVEDQLRGRAGAAENTSSSGSVSSPTVLSPSKPSSAKEPETAKARQHIEGFGGAYVNGSSTSPEINAPDSIHERMPRASRDGGSRMRHPYVLSESVKQECARIAHLAKADCNDHLTAIARLASEVRDPAWADATEESIRSIVDSQPGFRVRSLECRSSVCALEIESPTSIFRQKHFQAISADITDIDRILVHEHPSSSLRVKVTSITFQRL